MCGPAICRMSPAAIIDFPALLTQTNNTDLSAISVVSLGFSRLAGDGYVEVGQQPSDAFFDVVADRADRVEALAGRIWEFPVS